MRTEKELIELIYNKVRTEGEVVPRDYQTIGGMWTVDTWQLDSLVKVQMMDEGWTKRIVTPNLVVAITGAQETVLYSLGDEPMLRRFATILGV